MGDLHVGISAGTHELSSGLPFVQQTVLPELSKTILTLRDLVVNDQFPGFRASSAVKAELRSATPAGLSSVDTSQAIRLVLDQFADLQRTHVLDGGLPRSLTLPDGRFLPGQASQVETRQGHTLDLGRESFRDRVAWRFRDDGSQSKLRPEVSSSSRTLDPDLILDAANDFQQRLGQMRDDYTTQMREQEPIPTNPSERHSFFHEYYSSESPRSRTLSEDVDMDATQASFMLAQEQSFPALPSTVSQQASMPPVAPDIEAVLRSLQQSGYSGLPGLPQGSNAVVPLDEDTSEDSEYNPTPAMDNGADEYDPMTLDIESEYEPDVVVNDSRSQAYHVPTTLGPFNDITAPQATHTAIQPTGNIDKRQQNEGQRSRRSAKQEAKQAVREERLFKKAREREERKARQRQERQRKQSKRQRQELRPPSPPTPPQYIMPPRPITSHAQVIPPPPLALTMQQSTYPAPAFGAVNNYPMQMYQSRAPSVAPSYGPSTSLGHTSVAPYEGMPGHPAPARMLAPGEAVVVRDQYGNTFIARPVAAPPPQPPVPQYRYQ